MKVEAQSIEELIEKSGTHAPSIQRLDALIVRTAPTLQRRLFSGPSITMIGYGELIWQNMSASGVWPLIAIAPQKHQISIYIAAERDGQSLVQLYGDRLGRTNPGKCCIRIRKYENLVEEQFVQLIHDAVAAAAEQQGIYGRNCAQPVD